MENNIISKELLSEVLGSPIAILDFDENKCEIRNSICFENYQLGVSYSYLYGNKETRFIPIHELAQMLKEWAFKIGYELSSGYLTHGVICHSGDTIIRCDVSYKNNARLEIMRFWEKTEYEAILKACQWILENKNN